MTASMSRKPRHCRGWILGLALLSGWLVSVAASSNDVAKPTTPEALVEQARQAEMAGDTARQFSLLREAGQLAPDSQLIRWQLGQLKVGDKWMSVEDAERIAAANPKQEEYRQ